MEFLMSKPLRPPFFKKGKMDTMVSFKRKEGRPVKVN